MLSDAWTPRWYSYVGQSMAPGKQNRLIAIYSGLVALRGQNLSDEIISRTV